MKITYVKHSCFTVEFAKEYGEASRHVALIFDYYQGKLPEFPEDADVYVFASHKHGDHYHQKIFQLANQYAHIQFILAKEIRMNEKYMERCNIPMKARDKICYVHANQTYEFIYGDEEARNEEGNLLKVRTYKSTDSGVAFLIECNGKLLYHAGDLNWWKAEIDSRIQVPEPELEKIRDSDIRMEYQFKKEMALLQEDIHGLCLLDDKHPDGIDAAFLPLDGRLGIYAGLGFTYYMNHCEIKNAYPMHLWENYKLIGHYKKSLEAKAFAGRIVDIGEQGQNWIV